MSSAAVIDVLIPTCNRPYALAMVLTALAGQNFERIRIVVSDQSDEEGVFLTPEVMAVTRILRSREIPVLAFRNTPRRGMAEQRAFLLANAGAPYSLFLDDDVLIENDLLQRLHDTIREQQCGFVGSALHGLSYHAEQRPQEQHIEFWDGRVVPEAMSPDCVAWERHRLHSAANLFHVQSRLKLTRDTTRHYRVAWVGGCVLFDTAKLREAGGFDFWQELPAEHCGEDVLAQVRVMARHGGCGIIPSGAYHMELPTTIHARQFDAPKMLHPAGGT
ncbi:glycosyltransferase family 2 protein [Massilia sp. GCM10020059]|uniref:Glycosyltransferase family 2 protein n=1 Tax=Massilia agrisoli TaxID=2892444 RepID=A0ABS8IRK1_9BURK|nr:glycosyltransferase family A protein [Massilia agrisoli]MCC6070546.1 glycosyltransferase family 2 protein [Massilia agrisoli]